MTSVAPPQAAPIGTVNYSANPALSAYLMEIAASGLVPTDAPGYNVWTGSVCHEVTLTPAAGSRVTVNHDTRLVRFRAHLNGDTGVVVSAMQDMRNGHGTYTA